MEVTTVLLMCLFIDFLMDLGFKKCPFCDGHSYKKE